jgi:hypothetical protein
MWYAVAVMSRRACRASGSGSLASAVVNVIPNSWRCSVFANASNRSISRFTSRIERAIVRSRTRWSASIARSWNAETRAGSPPSVYPRRTRMSSSIARAAASSASAASRVSCSRATRATSAS